MQNDTTKMKALLGWKYVIKENI